MCDIKYVKKKEFVIFNRYIQLTRRLRSYLFQDKPFKCDVEGCNFSSKRRDKLKEHKGRLHKPGPDPAIDVKARPCKITNANTTALDGNTRPFKVSPTKLQSIYRPYNAADSACPDDPAVVSQFAIEPAAVGQEEPLPSSQIPYIKEEILGL